MQYSSNRPARATARAFALGLALTLAACGGGGGGGGGAAGIPNDVPPPNNPLPAVTVTDATLATGQDGTTVEVAIRRNDSAPVLLQFDVELLGPPGLSFPVTDAARPVTGDPVDSARLDGTGRRLRVVVGTPGNVDPLRSGGLLRLQVDAASDRQPGVTTVRISRVVAADADGAAIGRERLGATVVDGVLRVE